MFFVIFFVHNTHTIDFKIYNIHNFSLKQSRVFVFLFFFFLFSGYTTAQLHGEHSLQVHRPWPERGKFFSFFFFFTKQTEQRTRTRRETHHEDQRNARIARICYRRLSRPLFQGGAVMSPTQTGRSSFVVIVVQQRTVSLSFVVVVPLLLSPISSIVS